MTNWKYYEDADFSDTDIVSFSLDTRDFYCYGHLKEDMPHSLKILSAAIVNKKYHLATYYYSEKEVLDLIKRFWQESKGDGEWKFVSIISSNKNINIGCLSYLRIVRTEKGFLICNKDYNVLNKNMLNKKIDSFK